MVVPAIGLALLSGGHTVVWPRVQDVFSTAPLYLRRCPSRTTFENLFIDYNSCPADVNSVSWGEGTLFKFTQRRSVLAGEDLGVSVGLFAFQLLGSWQMGATGLTWVPCLEPAPLNPYIQAQWSRLCRQLPTSQILHPVGQSSAELTRRSTLIKSLPVPGTWCLWWNSGTCGEPAEPLGLPG